MALPAALGIPTTFLLLQVNSALGITPGSPTPQNPAAIFALLGWYVLIFAVGTVVYSLVSGTRSHDLGGLQESSRKSRAVIWRRAERPDSPDWNLDSRHHHCRRRRRAS